MKQHRETSFVLAGRAGTYRETRPIPLLRGHFQCAWTNTVRHDHVGQIAVVPDGCVDLLWIDDKVVVAGPDISVAHPSLAPGTTVLGLRFQPGAAKIWLGLPMSEIVGCQVDLRDLWGRKGCDLEAMILETDVTENRMLLWQTRLLHLLPGIDTPDRDIPAIFDLMKGSRPEGSKIRRVLDHLDISERTLRRRCHHHFGYGPKTLDRILRFQNVLHIARTQPGAGLSGLAFEAGYADQAHLNREIQALSGMSAGTLVRQLTS